MSAYTIMVDALRLGALQNNAWIKEAPSAYTPFQVRLWLERMAVDLGAKDDTFPPPSLKTLKILVKQSLVTFPFENTDMHYTSHHSMDVSSEGIFKRLVEEGQGGSYCFGLNGLMLEMLRGLGYRAFAGAARVNNNPASLNGSLEYTSLNHQVIFVQPENDSNQTYLVDVGFGGGLTRPILLSNSDKNLVMGIDATEHHRLVWIAAHSTSIETFKGSDIPGAMKWSLQVLHGNRESKNSDNWRVLYSFSEEEFYGTDFHDASFVVFSLPDPKGLFWNNLVCVKYFLEDEANTEDESDLSSEIAYRITMLGREVKKRGKGRSETMKTINTENERIQALWDFFGIGILKDNVRHISGRVPALV